jgi:uncharacterized membrane protein
MDDAAFARAIHELSVVLWIGGVSFVTTVLMPVIRYTRPPHERLATFQPFGNVFAWQARISVALAGLSGFYLTYRFDSWDRFSSGQYWWMGAMLGLWLIFAVKLSNVELLFFPRRSATAALEDQNGRTFARIQRFHEILCILSLVVLFAVAGGAHGMF